MGEFGGGVIAAAFTHSLLLDHGRDDAQDAVF
jgi:hypothetical protein